MMLISGLFLVKFEILVMMKTSLVYTSNSGYFWFNSIFKIS